jgi:hypothetical protein
MTSFVFYTRVCFMNFVLLNVELYKMLCGVLWFTAWAGAFVRW